MKYTCTSFCTISFSLGVQLDFNNWIYFCHASVHVNSWVINNKTSFKPLGNPRSWPICWIIGKSPVHLIMGVGISLPVTSPWVWVSCGLLGQMPYHSSLAEHSYHTRLMIRRHLQWSKISINACRVPILSSGPNFFLVNGWAQLSMDSSTVANTRVRELIIRSVK